MYIHLGNKKNIREMTGKEILNCYNKDCTKILVGCAPCQPFSNMSFKRFTTNVPDSYFEVPDGYGYLNLSWLAQENFLLRDFR